MRWTRRALGAAAFLAGIASIGWSFCPFVVAFLDYVGLIDSWTVACPSKIRSQIFLIGGFLVFLVGHRLFTGRNLRTGEKPEA